MVCWFERKGARSMLKMSQRQRYLSWQPAIMNSVESISAEEWNLLAQGLSSLLSLASSTHSEVSRLKAHRSSRSAIPYPPKINRYG